MDGMRCEPMNIYATIMRMRRLKAQADARLAGWRPCLMPNPLECFIAQVKADNG